MKRTQKILRKNINISVEIVGTNGLPSPRNAPEKTSLIPQIKYVLETIIIFCCEYIITSGVEDIIDESSPENIAENAPMVAPNIVVITIDFFIDSFTLWMFLAPRFCATKGVTARDGE